MKKYFVLLFVLLFLDQLIKVLVVNPVRNFGIFLGFWNPPGRFLLILWCLFIFMLCVFFVFIRHLRWPAIFMLAGISSQLVDRVRWEYGIDFFSFYFFPNVSFNFADVYILFGGVAMIFTLILKEKEAGLFSGRKLFKRG